MASNNAAIPLYPYQQRWLRDASRYKVGMFARQTGKTFTSTLEIVNSCYAAEAQGRRERWVILSSGERQAKEAMQEGVQRHLRAYNLAIDALEYEFQAENRSHFAALEVVLPGGSRITALPANPDTARGFSANVFLDEFAFHAQSRAIWQALFPVISAGYRLRVMSTPNGKGNRFYELFTGEDALWSRHRVDIHQAVADGLPRELPELRAALGDEDAWHQEYELHWLDEASAWLPYTLINAAENELAGEPSHYQGGPVFVGVDIARRHDLFVIWVLEPVGDVLWTRELITRRGITFAEQDALLSNIFQRYLVARCCMDQTGMGEKPVEDARRRHGTSRVEGVLFTGPTKLLLATQGKEAFEDQRIRIPAGESALRADLHSLRKVAGPTGNVRFDVDRSEAAQHSHADRAWALFLALHAAAAPQMVYAYTRVDRHAAHAKDPFSRLSRRNAGFALHRGIW